MAKLETVEIPDGRGGTMIVNKADDDAGLYDHIKKKRGKAKSKPKAKAKK